MKSRKLEISEVGLIVAALRLQASMIGEYREQSANLAADLVTVHVFAVEDDEDAAMLVSLIAAPVGRTFLTLHDSPQERTLQTDLLEDR